MHEEDCQKGMAEVVGPTVSKLSDEQWLQVLVFFNWFPAAWDLVGTAGQTKARVFVETCEASRLPLFLSEALAVPSLRALALSRVKELRPDELGNVEPGEPSSEYLDQLIDRYLGSHSFMEAENNAATLILPNVAHLTKPQLIRVLQGFCDNDQIAYAWGIRPFMITVLDLTAR